LHPPSSSKMAGSVASSNLSSMGGAQGGGDLKIRSILLIY
jgi:hypothetical protein